MEMSLDINHELALDYTQSSKRKLRQEGMLPDETGNMQKHKRPMRGLRTKGKKRGGYCDY